MKTFKKSLAVAGFAACAFATIAAPAAAQVQGKVATASISRAVLGTTALQTALNQVGTTYKAQIETAQAKQAQLSTLAQPFDANGDKQIDDNEGQAMQSSPNYAQIQTLQGEIDSIEGQVTGAQIYAVEQILAQYQAAMSEVAAQQQIVMVIDPASLQFAGEGTDITQQISTSLNAKVPSVGIVPPANWRPRQQSVQIFQEINQRILLQQMAAQQQAQQQQQGNQQAPVGR